LKGLEVYDYSNIPWVYLQLLNSSTPQLLNPSTPQPLNSSTPQLLNPPTLQPSNPSTLQLLLKNIPPICTIKNIE